MVGQQHRLSATTAFATLALSVGGCASDDFRVELNFPSEQTFLWTDFGRVFLVDLPDGDRGRCPVLIQQAETGRLSEDVLDDTGQVPICQFSAGEVRLPRVPDQPVALVVIGSSQANLPILHGCRTFDPYLESEPGGTLTVSLAPHPVNYADYTMGQPACASTVAEKCSGTPCR